MSLFIQLFLTKCRSVTHISNVNETKSKLQYICYHSIKSIMYRIVFLKHQLEPILVTPATQCFPVHHLIY